MPLALSGGHRASLPQIPCRPEQAKSFTVSPPLPALLQRAGCSHVTSVLGHCVSGDRGHGSKPA